MIFDPDHLSVRGRQEALDFMEARRYPGVVSSHSWATPDSYPRIYALGGMTAPYAGGSTGFVRAWRERKKMVPAGRCFGIGFGADANGLGTQGGPRGAGVKNPVAYPFTGLGGVTISRQVSGQRVYDVNTDGVAHYGLYADWIEDLRRLAGDEIVKDLACGAESYLQVWERANGVAPSGCLDAARFDELTAGMPTEQVLRAVGQPERRQGATFTYCVNGTQSRRVLTFDANGVLVLSATAEDGLLAVTGADRFPWFAGLLVLAAAVLRRALRT
jgi:hypothetical protein